MKASKYENLSMTHRLQNFLLTYYTFSNQICRNMLKLIINKLNQRSNTTHMLGVQFLKSTKMSWLRTNMLDQAGFLAILRSRFGPVTYLVDFSADNLWKCHVDQLKNYYPDSNFSEQTSAQQSETDLRKLEMLLLPQLQ